MSFQDPIVVIGHRGAAGLAPENTLPGFRRAYACGVSAVELDVYAVEGELLVIHDDTLERTTSGRGAVMATPLAALRRLDAGAGASIPLLSEVVAELPATVGLNIELKGPGTADPVAAFLRTRPGLDVLVSSFDLAQLAHFHDLAADVPVAPLFSRWNSGIWDTAAALDAWSINLSRRAATPQYLAEAARRGFRTLVYTVNALPLARRLIAAGATGIFTDRPDLLRAEALRDASTGRQSPDRAGSARR